MSIWVFILFVFAEGVMVHKDIGGGRTEIECEAVRIANEAVAKENGHVLRQTMCVEVKLPEATPAPKPMPQGDGPQTGTQRGERS